MKQKIKEALRQEYKSRLELDDDQLEGVAAFAATFVTDESKVEEFVKNDATLAMLKSYQSMLDKDRAKRKGESEQGQQGSENGNQPPKNNPDPTKGGNSEMAQLIKLMQEQNEQMRKQNEALTARFDAFEAERNAKFAFSTAEETFKGNDYVKKYADEATDAWDRATEMYEATGKKWTAQELQEKAMGYFNKAVAKKGVDTTKPFESDGGGGASEAEKNAAFAAEIRNALGMNKE